MELETGVCELCSTEDKVIKTPQAEHILKSLGSLLKNQINNSEFNRIQSSLRACPKCLQHIVILKSTKIGIGKSFTKRGKKCFICMQNNDIVDVTNWTSVDNLLRSSYSLDDPDCTLCLECILYVNTLHTMRSELLQRYPKLKQGDKSEQTIPKDQNVSPLKHLTPLKNTELNFDDHIKSDTKFMNQVLYISLGAPELKIDSATTEKNRKRKRNHRDRNRKRKRSSVSPSTPEESQRKRKKGSVSPASSVSSQSSQEDSLSNREQKKACESPSNSQDEGHTRKTAFFKIKLKVHPVKKLNPKATKESTLDINAELSKHNINNELRVNIEQMDFGSHTKCMFEEPSSNQEENMVNNSKKRKSVSFAEEKNVQIEYMEYPNSNVNKIEENCIVTKTILKKSARSTKPVLNEEIVDQPANVEAESEDVDNASNDPDEDDPTSLDQDSSNKDGEQNSDDIKSDNDDQENVEKNTYDENADHENSDQNIGNLDNFDQNSTKRIEEKDHTESLESDSQESEVCSKKEDDNPRETKSPDLDCNESQRESQSPDLFEGFDSSTENNEEKDNCGNTDSNGVTEESEKPVENPSDDFPNETPNESYRGIIDSSSAIIETSSVINGCSIESKVLDEATKLSEDIIIPPEEMSDIPKEDSISLVQQAELENLDATLPCVTGNENDLCPSDSECDKNVLDKQFDDMNDEGVGINLSNSNESLSEPIVTDDLLDRLQLRVLPDDIMDDTLIK